jgi:hypothetical protein
MAATIPPHCKRFQAVGGGPGVPRQSIRHPVSLRLNAKRGIVGKLDAADWVRIRD